MSALKSVVDEFVAWLLASPYRAYGEAIAYRPIDFDDYREVFATCGFPLPQSLAQFVEERGLLALPRLDGPLPRSGDVLGLVFEPAHRVFENYLHAQAAFADGVEQHEHWLVFATVAGDLDGAFAFDDRFLGGDEFAVGAYHQDEVYHAQRAATEKLLYHEDSLETFLSRYLDEAKALFERTDDAALLPALEQLSPPIEYLEKPQVHPKDWRALHEHKLLWKDGSSRAFRLGLATSADLEVVEQILTEIDHDLSAQATRTIPGLGSLKAGKSGWPYNYPGPRELLERLAPDGPWGRRAIVRWALDHCGFNPDHNELVAAKRMLDQRCDSELSTPEMGEVSARLALRANRDPELTPTERNYARALAWGLSSLKPAYAYEAIVRTLQVAAPKRKANPAPLNFLAVYRKLAALIRGRPDFVPKSLRPPEPEVSATVAELISFMKTFSGPQKELLITLEDEWLERLQAESTASRNAAQKAIKKKIKSKKLVTQLGDLLKKLDP